MSFLYGFTPLCDNAFITFTFFSLYAYMFRSKNKERKLKEMLKAKNTIKINLFCVFVCYHNCLNHEEGLFYKTFFLFLYIDDINRQHFFIIKIT